MMKLLQLKTESPTIWSKSCMYCVMEKMRKSIIQLPSLTLLFSPSLMGALIWYSRALICSSTMTVRLICVYLRKRRHQTAGKRPVCSEESRHRRRW
ncbi:hypothetical protein D3C75_1021510 [compost metagenome]